MEVRGWFQNSPSLTSKKPKGAGHRGELRNFPFDVAAPRVFLWHFLSGEFHRRGTGRPFFCCWEA